MRVLGSACVHAVALGNRLKPERGRGAATRPRPQVGVFSATLPPEALEITRKFMNKPVSAGRGLGDGS